MLVCLRRVPYQHLATRREVDLAEVVRLVSVVRFGDAARRVRFRGAGGPTPSVETRPQGPRRVATRRTHRRGHERTVGFVAQNVGRVARAECDDRERGAQVDSDRVRPPLVARHGEARAHGDERHAHGDHDGHGVHVLLRRHRVCLLVAPSHCAQIGARMARRSPQALRL